MIAADKAVVVFHSTLINPSIFYNKYHYFLNIKKIIYLKYLKGMIKVKHNHLSNISSAF